MSILNVDNISKSYGDFKAVNNISFHVEKGRMYGVLGPNGAGKTTTIRMIMNILVPDSGSITLFGERISDDLKNRIGYLPEERGLYVRMKVLEMLVFLGELNGQTHQEAINTSNKWLERMELQEWKDKKIEELSKGMQQKIQFIGTVMHNPDLIILDEPFSGLDPVNVQLLKNVLMELKEEGRVIMFSTHMMEAAEKLCDDILLINKGQKVLGGDLIEIKKQHGKNSVQVEYEGNGEFIKSLPFIEKLDDYGNYLEVGLQDGHSSQELLKAIIDKIEVRRFQTTESSLNDIFIEKVGRENHV